MGRRSCPDLQTGLLWALLLGPQLGLGPQRTARKARRCGVPGFSGEPSDSLQLAQHWARAVHSGDPVRGGTASNTGLRQGIVLSGVSCRVRTSHKGGLGPSPPDQGDSQECVGRRRRLRCLPISVTALPPKSSLSERGKPGVHRLGFLERCTTDSRTGRSTARAVAQTEAGSSARTQKTQQLLQSDSGAGAAPGARGVNATADMTLAQVSCREQLPSPGAEVNAALEDLLSWQVHFSFALSPVLPGAHSCTGTPPGTGKHGEAQSCRDTTKRQVCWSRDATERVRGAWGGTVAPSSSDT